VFIHLSETKTTLTAVRPQDKHLFWNFIFF